MEKRFTLSVDKGRKTLTPESERYNQSNWYGSKKKTEILSQGRYDTVRKPWRDSKKKHTAGVGVAWDSSCENRLELTTRRDRLVTGLKALHLLRERGSTEKNQKRRLFFSHRPRGDDQDGDPKKRSITGEL